MRRHGVSVPVRVFSRLAGRVAGTGPPNLFLTLGRHRRLFWGWLHFAGRLMPGGRLPRRLSELVILRVATLRECAYELEHHRRLGRRAGLTAADLRRVRHGPAAPGWTWRERLLLSAADELHATRDLSDATRHDLLAAFGDTVLIELVMLVGHYEMLATAITALRIAPDQPRSGSD
ncbi:carboxymuconolactone decarboxylase family protein [Nonomuraea typhae]|uniref:carboxymuconolactone decarboxylase family protein n=1 Tax=Nonomuraea typhae TaxID=2603600 RepID=UPI0012F7B0B2|nr:carboxymuconolactone decarboxylase family protein [Nonomuraea typhae]